MEENQAVSNSSLNQFIINKLPNSVWVMALAAAITFFVVSAVLAYRSIDLITQNNISINNTSLTINLIKDLSRELVAAESSQRGYLLTEDADYLAPYHKTLRVVDDLLDQLEAATQEHSVQSARFEALKKHVLNKIAEMQRIVVLTDREKIRAAVREVKKEEGVELMRTISLLLEEMENEELSQLNRNKIVAAENRQFIVVALLLANCIGLLLSMGIFYIWYRNASEVAELNVALSKANVELEEKVGVRTQALLQYSEELQRSNRELEEFAFVASHDLQEPLRKIRAFGDRLQQKFSVELGDVGSDYVLRMQAASERMSALIDDLLSFSRVTTSQRSFTSQNLTEIIHRVMDDLDYAIEDSGAQVHIDPLPVIEADGSQIAQVFMNLIANSLKFHAPGRRPIVTVTSEANLASPLADDARMWCRIQFADQGIGFESQYAERVFSLFQRLHGRDEYSGTGIGLALCRKIIERHGGIITAQSEPGDGAVFTLFLPMTQTTIEPLSDLLTDA
ncbi:CHASE3 domain-containing protein [Cellvibrio sp. pealriver]|uniref:sensor histidine kinase n=1 Tax=Cellvibrio sp. pealriver TaxID=1622269 RepID=UPI00066FC24A|nr:sensor histidine kinase [Cellvibrio sp. pealriver]